MREEWRTERCPDCGADRERCWLVTSKAVGGKGGSWKTVATPTKWTSLCDCDAA
jgi:hypothetical protein